MGDFNIFLKQTGIISLVALPFLAGIFIYGKDELMSKIIALVLFVIGIIILIIVVRDYLKTREARRRHVGYGDLK